MNLEQVGLGVMPGWVDEYVYKGHVYYEPGGGMAMRSCVIMDDFYQWIEYDGVLSILEFYLL